MKKWLEGKKTNIVAGATILTTVAAWASDEVTLMQALVVIAAALATMTGHALLQRLADLLAPKKK